MKIPAEVKNVLKTLEKGGFSAYIVGGCVRDLLLGKEPKDWDVTTNAKPEEITKLFPDSFYENTFGTVTVNTGIEVTTYRIEGKYSDKRHPDSVSFTNSLEEDLKRRDFTINAMALSLPHPPTPSPSPDLWSGEGEGALRGNSVPLSLIRRGARGKVGLTDLFSGQEDLKNKLVRAVGEPKDRFSEDALRMMRAVRLATELEFSIEENTFQAIKKDVRLINSIAKERVRDELIKIINSKNAYKGILMLSDTGLLKEILPELAAGIGVGQNKHHIYTVFEHNALALKWAAEHDYPFQVRLAALLHDVGKPNTKKGDGPDSTFYGHELAGARITSKILSRLRFPQKSEQGVAMLVKNHLFYYNVGEVTANSVRRLVAKVGPENMPDLIKVRICDRMGSGVPKPEPYRLRHFQYMVERVQKDPISRKMLKVDGDDIIKLLGLEQGIKVGQIIAVLLDEVLDDPKLNKKKYLLKRALDVARLPERELHLLTKKSKEKEREFDKAVDEEIKERYWVK